MARPRESFDKTFFPKIRINDLNQCWEWTGYTDRRGYGRTYKNRIPVSAHRVSWEIHKGSIPKGTFVCHSCDNTRCVNPSHLFLGSPKENTADMLKKKRDRSRGKRSAKAKLKESQVIAIFYASEPYAILAKRYNVSTSTIAAIKRCQNWGYLFAPAGWQGD